MIDLPEPDYTSTQYDSVRSMELRSYSAGQMRAYGEACAKAEREACAALCVPASPNESSTMHRVAFRIRERGARQPAFDR